jgi:protein-S-isoprenylcysteine O-methyltransferase Ste14
MEGRRLYVFTAVQIFAAGVMFYFLAAPAYPWNVTRVIGTVLAVIGISFIGVARYQLGTSFSVKPEARKLVTIGLYSKIRNPIYVFGMVMITGLIVALQRPALLTLLVVVAIVQMIRARREAQVLEAAFGDAYREYWRKTWF